MDQIYKNTLQALQDKNTSEETRIQLLTSGNLGFPSSHELFLIIFTNEKHMTFIDTLISMVSDSNLEGLTLQLLGSGWESSEFDRSILCKLAARTDVNWIARNHPEDIRYRHDLADLLRLDIDDLANDMSLEWVPISAIEYLVSKNVYDPQHVGVLISALCGTPQMSEDLFLQVKQCIRDSKEFIWNKKMFSVLIGYWMDEGYYDLEGIEEFADSTSRSHICHHFLKYLQDNSATIPTDISVWKSIIDNPHMIKWEKFRNYFTLAMNKYPNLARSMLDICAIKPYLEYPRSYISILESILKLEQ